MQGFVKSDGDKLSFVTDNDSKSWDLMNPEALKEYTGKRVKINAHVYPDQNRIHVTDVKEVKASAKSK
jgi:hypothetical protein